MSNSTNLGLPLMAENVANGYALFNSAVAAFDQLAGSCVTKTATYAMAITDKVVLTNQSGAITVTLPPLTGLYIGQPFFIRDISGTAQTNNVTIAVPSGVAIDGTTNGTQSINVANGLKVYVYDGSGYRSVDSIDTRLKRRHTVELIAGATPGSTGAQVAERVLPLGTDNASVTWVVKRIFFRVQTAGGAPQVTVEKYTGTGAFSATTVGSVTLGSGANEGSITSFTTSQLTSGDKVRLNVNTLATAANWTVLMELQEL